MNTTVVSRLPTLYVVPRVDNYKTKLLYRTAIFIEFRMVKDI